MLPVFIEEWVLRRKVLPLIHSPRGWKATLFLSVVGDSPVVADMVLFCASDVQHEVLDHLVLGSSTASSPVNWTGPDTISNTSILQALQLVIDLIHVIVEVRKLALCKLAHCQTMAECSSRDRLSQEWFLVGVSEEGRERWVFGVQVPTALCHFNHGQKTGTGSFNFLVVDITLANPALRC